ncbi:RNA polymerase II transcription mediator complex subunit 9 [Teratosphaeria destructans]|uniref:Mediator of RNA polymerase II transcription subunit 9 n=1 Tax=Teratosphaeria destructans TaxID=418781 RepID=A0A9W7SKB5_9PEZI|nr:RNA polymerase II transcription mediator complex subunit 9 [Teratosphaeria destructans]
MALKQSATPEATTAADSSTSQPSSQPPQHQHQHQHQPNLPAPELFDILPQLHEILARIDHTPADGEQESDDDLGAQYHKQSPLDPKDLPAAILPLKAQMRKAMKEIERLPDIDRSVEEQDEEIRELEERLKKQQEMVRKMGDMRRRMLARLGS